MSLYNNTEKSGNTKAFTTPDAGLFQPLFSSDQLQKDGFTHLQSKQDNTTGFARFGAADNQQSSVFSSHEERISLIEREAYEKGFAQGEKDGFELGETKGRKRVENLDNLLGGIGDLKDELVKRYEKEIIEMIFAIAKKVVHTRLDFEEKAVRGPILNALELSAGKNEINLKLNPEDLDYVESLRPELFSKFQSLKTIMITSDPAIKRGGCKLESDSGDIDATIETQLEMIHKYLQEAYMG
jgi:flagellar assembly protein FliH